MSNDIDAWFQDAFGLDIGSTVNAIKEKAKAKATAASDTVADAVENPGDTLSGAWQAVKDKAASEYAEMKEDAKTVAEAEDWVAGQIDDAQDAAAAGVQSLADTADGIPVVEQVADAASWGFDQGTQLTAGTWEGGVGLVGGVAQMVANPVDTAKGLYALAEHLPTPLPGPNPLRAAHGLVDVGSGEATLADTTAELFDPAKQQKDSFEFAEKLAGGIADDYKKTVGDDGDIAKGIGRGIFDVASNFFGPGEAKIAATADVAKTATLTEATSLKTLLDDAARTPLDEAAKLREAPEASKLLDEVLDETAELFKARDRIESMLDDATRQRRALDAADAEKLAEARKTAATATSTEALSEAVEVMKSVLDDASEAIGASEAVESMKTIVGKAGAPKAGAVTAENINRVTGMQTLLGEMDRLKLTLNDLGLTPDQVIAMANRDPVAAIADMRSRVEIAKVRAAEVEAHAVETQAKMDAAYAEAEAERRWYREDTVGATPPKSSPTGRQVIERMRAEGKIRGTPPNEEVFHEPTGQWYSMNECDMGHTTDAVSWWNREGKYHGDKSGMVREWMKDPANYELEPRSINRSRGSQLDENYHAPHDDPITPEELAGKPKDPKPDPER